MMLGPLDSLNIVIDLVKSSTATASASLTGAALSILAACVGIVIVKAWLESILENDAVGFVGESLEVLIVGTVCTMVINGIGTINSMAWGLMDSAMTAMGGGAGGTGSAVDRIWSSTINTTSYFFGFYAQQSSDCSLTQPMECFEALADNILLSLALIVVMLLLLVYVAVMLLQIIRGVFMIAAGLIWLPLATGFYPLNESWAKNAVGVIASGIAFMGMVAFLLGIVTHGADLLVQAAVAGDFNHIPGVPTAATAATAAASAPGDTLPRAFGAMTVAVMLFVLAMAAGTAMSKASEIFGSVGGMLRVHKPRGGGGGKQSGGDGGKNAGPTTTPAPAPASTPPGGGPSGAAIQGAAAVGTSGASVAAEGGAEVAGAAAGEAASTADAAGAGAGAADGAATPGGAPEGAPSASSEAAPAATSAADAAGAGGGSAEESAGSSGGGGLRGEARHAAAGAHAMGAGGLSAAIGGAIGAAKGAVGAMRAGGRGGLVQHGGSAVGRAAMAGMKAGAAGGVAQMRAGASAVKAGAIGAVKAAPGAAGRGAIKAAGFTGRGLKQGAGVAGKVGGFVAHNMMEN